MQDDANLKVELQRALRIYSDKADAYYHLARVTLKEGQPREALKLIEQAEENFKEGYFYNRPYVEVLEQIYLEDIETLEIRIKKEIG